MLDINRIRDILPHSYPFLLVDRILELEEGQRIRGLKNVTINEEFFQGHFPKKPVMPGVLIIEAMAQVGGVVFLSQREHQDKIAYFTGIDKARFRRPVEPGDQLIIDVEVLKFRSRVGKVEAKAMVDDELVAEARLMFALD